MLTIATAQQIAVYLFPALWGLWILYAVFRSINRSLNQLLLHWLCIDLFMLLAYVGFWWKDNDWFRRETSNSIEVLIISPLFYPLAAGTRHFSESFYKKTFGSISQLEDVFIDYGLGDAIANWLMCTIAILPETLLIIIISQMIFRSRLKVSRKDLLSTSK